MPTHETNLAIFVFRRPSRQAILDGAPGQERSIPQGYEALRDHLDSLDNLRPVPAPTSDEVWRLGSLARFGCIPARPGDPVEVTEWARFDQSLEMLVTEHVPVFEMIQRHSAGEPNRTDRDPLQLMPLNRTPSPRPKVEDVLSEFDQLVGLEAVKAHARRLTALAAGTVARKERGLPVTPINHHMVFTGNPGTGKTTVARLFGKLFAALGIVAKGHFIELNRADVVGKWIGWTEDKVKEYVASAVGGVLFLDEAYALATGGENDFGKVAIDTLVPLLENLRDEFVAIFAGYSEPMRQFIAANPGLERRTPNWIHFADYSNDELLEIFLALCRQGHYTLSEPGAAVILDRLSREPRGESFGNGGLMRNWFEKAVAAQSIRLLELGDTSTEALSTLEASDVAADTRFTR